MPVTTPAVAQHLLDHLVTIPALSGTWAADGATRNAWATPELPSVPTGVPMKALFVTQVSERRQLHGDGQFRWFSVQLLVRWSRDDFEGARAAATALYDALHLLGAFTVGGTSYVDVRAEGGPIYLGQAENDPHMFALNVEVWFDG